MVNDMSTTSVPPSPRPSGWGRHRGDEPHLLREVVRAYQALMAGFSRGTGMTTSRFLLARLLGIAGDDGVGTMELARQLGVNPAAVTRQLNEMEREGLVRRRADRRDGRRRTVRLSAKGKEQFETIHERAHELERSLGAALGEDEMRAAAAVLSKLRAFVEAIR